MCNPFDELNDRLLNIESLLISLQAKDITPSKDGVTEQPITQKELCAYLNITEQTIIRYKKRKLIPFYQIGTSVRFNLSAVLKALGK